MKKKPNIKPTEEDLKDWQSFIENINSIEDKDAPLDNSIIEKNNDRLFEIRKDTSPFNLAGERHCIYVEFKNLPCTDIFPNLQVNSLLFTKPMP